MSVDMLKMKFDNVYFFNGTAYAGKSTMVKRLAEKYDGIACEENYHVSSITFEKVLKSIKAQYVHGLTATPIRKDGQQPIIFMQCGPIRFSADSKSQIQKQSFRRYLIPRFTWPYTYHGYC